MQKTGLPLIVTSSKLKNLCFLIDTGATHNILFAYVYEHFKNEFKVLKREHIANQIKETLHRVAPTAKIILYGSEARGDARKDSDIDLLVLLDKDKPTYDEENEVRWPLYELEIKTGVSINPYIISRKSWENRPFKTPFYVNVVNEGIVL